MAEPDIRKQADNRIQIQLPGLQDPERAIKLIGKTAHLEFKVVDDNADPDKAQKGVLPPGEELSVLRHRNPDGSYLERPIVLRSDAVMEHDAWEGQYVFKRPGVGIFYVVPEPYFEPAEDKFIEHITKVVVPAFGEEEGWDEPVGLPAEIVPLTRPFGNYTGNVFTGKVLLDGKPAAGVRVEVEYDNKDKAYAAPNEYMTTQVVTTDVNGVFSYAVPFAGWWGFAALSEAPQTIDKDGAAKKVERGAVLWAKFVDPKHAAKKGK